MSNDNDNNMSTNAVDIVEGAIAVRVTPVPGQPKLVTLSPDAATVQDALKVAGITYDNDSVFQVNAEPAALGTTLAEGDRVTVAKGAKGNS